MPKKHRGNALAAIHETAADLHRVGGMDQRTMRKFDTLCLTPITIHNSEMTPQPCEPAKRPVKRSLPPI